MRIYSNSEGPGNTLVEYPNEMVNEADVQATITLLARYLEEDLDAGYTL